MSEFGFGGIESVDSQKDLEKKSSQDRIFNLPEMKAESLGVRQQNFNNQVSNLEEQAEKLGLGSLSEETKKMIESGTIGRSENERKSLETSRERELKRELKENDLIIPEGKDIENAESLLKENGVPCEVEKYMKGVDGEVGRVPAEFVLVVGDPQNPEKPAPFEFVKNVFQFLQENGIVVRYAKNPEKAGAEMEDENQNFN